MTNKSLEDRIQRLEDLHEIQNLMSRYEYCHTASKHEETARMFAQKAPDVRAEVNNIWGVYEGQESIWRLYVGVHEHSDGDDRKGRMFMHTLTTPVIEVAGDGKTAKGLWISPGNETKMIDGKLQPYWAWCKYGVDFIKEDGEWKFWHVKVYGIFLCPYDKSWVDAPVGTFTPKPPELMGDKESEYNWMYSTDAVTEDIPAPPVPYETWDDKSMA
ncbi:nuclear transport factor 2 family protein [Deltaproteobacteria bacterium]|nr:nuclear transport factor 2 family protein [Deltaproteobacteria bacterium]